MIKIRIAFARMPLAAAALVAAVLALSGNPACAEHANSTGSPVDEFSKQLEEFQKSVPNLNRRIQESASTIDAATDIAKARGEVDELRDEVSTLLGAVADNGPVSQLGAKALSHINDKLRQLPQDARYKPEERQFLIDQWQQL